MHLGPRASGTAQARQDGLVSDHGCVTERVRYAINRGPDEYALVGAQLDVPTAAQSAAPSPDSFIERPAPGPAWAMLSADSGSRFIVSEASSWMGCDLLRRGNVLYSAGGSLHRLGGGKRQRGRPIGDLESVACKVKPRPVVLLRSSLGKKRQVIR